MSPSGILKQGVIHETTQVGFYAAADGRGMFHNTAIYSLMDPAPSCERAP